MPWQHLIRNQEGSFLQTPTWGKIGVIKPEQLLAIEALQSLQYPVTDTSGANSSHDLAFEIVSATSNVGDCPVVADDLLMCWRVVADEGEDGHDNVFGDRDDVTSGYLKKVSQVSMYALTSATVIL